jgi:hypothetical protein
MQLHRFHGEGDSMRRLFRTAPLVLLVVAACGGTAATSDSSDDIRGGVPATPQAKLVHAMPHGSSSTASFRTLKNATCTLHAAGEPADADRLTLYADDDGIARLHLQHVDPSSNGGQVTLQCTDDSGKTMTHTLDVRIDDTATAQAPAAYEKTGKRTLPALDVDPLSLSAADLVARGYPPRPDPKAAPGQYQKWVSLLSHRPTVIEPHVVKNPSRVHGPIRGLAANGTSNASGTSNNWSGYVIATGNAAPAYGEIFGAWYVPRAYAESGFWHLNYSSFWVGMDGYGTPDVVQAGTDENTQTVFGLQFSSYGAWTEWYPLSSQSISNFSVNPGDEIYCWVWVGTANDTWSATGGVGWFYVWNVTQNNVAAYLSTAAPSGTVFNGHQAEWVMERPTVNGSVANLANYSSARIYDAWAYDYAYQTHYYGSDYSINVTMANGSTVLSTVAPVDQWTMQFTWHNYN